MKDQSREIYEAAFAASPLARSLDRSVDAMTAVGLYHAVELRCERFAMQKRHARQLVQKILGDRVRCFDWSWFRSESAQNDRTIRIVERWFRRLFHLVLEEQGT